MTSRQIGALTALVLLAHPAVSQACAVCFGADDEATGAYRLSTLALSALPLLVLGAFFGWLRWRIRTRDVEPQRPSAPLPDRAPGAARRSG